MTAITAAAAAIAAATVVAAAFVAEQIECCKMSSHSKKLVSIQSRASTPRFVCCKISHFTNTMPGFLIQSPEVQPTGRVHRGAGAARLHPLRGLPRAPAAGPADISCSDGSREEGVTNTHDRVGGRRGSQSWNASPLLSGLQEGSLGAWSSSSHR